MDYYSVMSLKDDEIGSVQNSFFLLGKLNLLCYLNFFVVVLCYLNFLKDT